jgi:hypothetical protein
MVKNRLLVFALCLFATLAFVGIGSASTVNFTSPTSNSGAYLNVSSIVINATSADANLTNITINLYNSTKDLVNQSNITSSPFIITFTNLVNGIYYFNATAVNSSADVINSSETRNVTIDTVYPSFSAFSDNNGTLVGNGTAYFNVSIANTNGTVWLLINNTNITATNLTGNLYNVSYLFAVPGVYIYSWHALGNGAGNNINVSANMSYTVKDWPLPTVQFDASSDSSSSGAVYYSRNSSYIRVTATNNSVFAIANITIFFYNSSWASTTMNGSSFVAVNITNLKEGFYHVNATANNSNGDVNVSETRTIVIDRTAPNVSLESPDDNEAFDTSGSSYNIGFEFNVTDASGSIANCSLIINGVVNETETGFIVNTTESISQSFEEDSYSWKIRCTDSAGNIADSSDIWDFDVTTFSGSDDTSDGGGGGAEASFWTMTYNVNQDTFKAEGYNRAFSKGQRMKVLIDGDTHYVGVINVSSDRAIINVSSTPQSATLNVGETKKFEVNTDGYYDISVKLNSISTTGPKANLSIMYLHEKMAAVANNLTAGNGTNQPQLLNANQNETLQGGNSISGATIGVSLQKNWKWILVGILVVIIAFVVIFWKKIWFWLSNLKHQHR